MKQSKVVIALLVLSALVLCVFQMIAADSAPPTRYEYVTIRWDGKENTHIIRPGGQVEFTGAELRKAHKPDRTDDRSFYMNLVMNGLTKEGYEFAGMTNDEIVMKRLTSR